MREGRAGHGQLLLQEAALPGQLVVGLGQLVVLSLRLQVSFLISMSLLNLLAVRQVLQRLPILLGFQLCYVQRGLFFFGSLNRGVILNRRGCPIRRAQIYEVLVHETSP